MESTQKLAISSVKPSTSIDRRLSVAPTLKALSFFDDGDLRLLPEDMKLRLATAAREVDLDHLPGIDKFSRQIDQDRGYEL